MFIEAACSSVESWLVSIRDWATLVFVDVASLPEIFNKVGVVRLF